MKRELYRTIALLSMISMAAAPLSAQTENAIADRGELKAEEAQNVEHVDAPAENQAAEEDDGMDMKEFLLGRFAVHFEKENIPTTAAAGIAVILAGAVAWKFWPKAATQGAAAGGKAEQVSPQTPPRTPPRTPTQASPSSSAGSTPSSKSPVRRNSMRVAKSSSPYGKGNQ